MNPRKRKSPPTAAAQAELDLRPDEPPHTMLGRRNPVQTDTAHAETGTPTMSKRDHRDALPLGTELLWYRIESILGHGSFGITYRAQDLNLERPVAIKEYLPRGLAMREGDNSIHPISEEQGEQYSWGLERFVAEARTLAKFEHPNIVRVLNIFEANNSAYMVIGYEGGASLHALVRQHKTLSEAAVLAIVHPLLSGLAAVHTAGFIHRDIKPSNIFIRLDGSPVLLDFGSARQAVSQRSGSVTSLYSPGYAPLEQYSTTPEDQGPWTDIYGMAATLYRVISGSPPVDAIERSRGLLQDQQDPLIPAVEIGAERYSEELLAAIDHGLSFKPQDRPRNVTPWQSEFPPADTRNGRLAIPEITPSTTEPPTLDSLVLTSSDIPANRQTGPGADANPRSHAQRRAGPLALSLLVATGAAAWYYRDQLTQTGPLSPVRTWLAGVGWKRATPAAPVTAPTKSSHTSEPARTNPELALAELPLSRLQELAASGDREAQYQLGRRYDNGLGGLGIDRDYAQAFTWYERAAKQGHSGAQFSLGLMYGQGQGAAQDYKRAAEWFKRAADQGDADAAYLLGMLHESGRGVPQNLAEAAALYRRAAERDNPAAQYALAMLYDTGRGVKRDREASVKWLKQAARRGHPDARAALLQGDRE